MNEPQIKLVLLIAALAGLFASLCYGVYALFYLLKIQEVMKKAWEQSVKVLDARRSSRKSLEQKTSTLYGEMEKKTFMARLDASLAYSGLYTRFPHLTAEKFAAGLLLLMCGEWILCWILTRSILTGLSAALLTGAVSLEAVKLLRAIRRRKMGRELLHFIDLMEIYALTCEDVIQIIGLAAAKVRNPLRAEIMAAVIDARHCGRSDRALRRLCNRLEHKYAKDLILNLDICSRAKANYRDVIREAKKMYLAEEAGQEKLRKLYKNSFFFTLVLCIMGISCLQFMLQMMGGQGESLQTLWMQGGMARAILIYLGVVAAAGLWRLGRKAFL